MLKLKPEPRPEIKPILGKPNDAFKPVPIRKKTPLTLGQKWADKITKWAGSWTFILAFVVLLLVWMSINTYLVLAGKFDPYPFILLNLLLSCVAALQAPVILMSQNRDVERDRHRAELDYYVNRRAEREIKILQKEILEIKAMLSKTSKGKELKRLQAEIELIQLEIENAGITNHKH